MPGEHGCTPRSENEYSFEDDIILSCSAFLNDSNMPQSKDISIDVFVLEYIKMWAGKIVNMHRDFVNDDFTLAYIIINLNRHVLNNELDDATQTKLKYMFHHDISREINELLHAIKNSRWIKLGRKLGFLKAIALR